MSVSKLIIADIQTTDLLFYDPDYGKQGYEFCRDRDIDCLPSLDDSTCFYRRNDHLKDFEPEKLPDERCIFKNGSIFHSHLLEKLREYHVLFVIKEGELSGVVHFADYNKPIISNWLYTQLATYERNLRQLASLNNLSDTDIGTYFADKLKQRQAKGKESKYFEQRLDAYQRQQKQKAQLPPFQKYYLDDLIGLLKHHDILQLQGVVTQLRNAVMHAHEPVNMVDVMIPDYIYDFATFETFFNRVQTFLNDARRVENRIRFIEDQPIPSKQ